jgi:hypothetical protein
LTTAAVVLEEQRAATKDDDLSLAPIRVAAVAAAPAVAPGASRVVLATIVLVQAAWLVVLAYLAYKLVI